MSGAVGASAALPAGVLAALVVATAVLARRAGAAAHRSSVVRRVMPPPVRGPIKRRIPAVPSRRLESALRSADLDVEAGSVAVRWLAIAVVGVALGALRWGLGGSLVALAVIAAGPLVLLAWRAGRQAQRLSAALPGFLEAVAGSLRAGASLPEALLASAEDPTGSALLDADLATVRISIGRGQPFADAVAAWAGRRPQPGVRLVAAALVLGAEAGGARARAIDGVAATLRDRQALAAEVDALSSQARASAVVMMCAPVVFAALGLLSDPDVSEFLLGTPAGLGCLLVGLGLDAAAGFWMMRIAETAI